MTQPIGTKYPAVKRWDIYDIADELADVHAQLMTGLVKGYDPIAHLVRLIDRTFEAARLSPDSAEMLRASRFKLHSFDEDLRDEINLPECHDCTDDREV